MFYFIDNSDFSQTHHGQAILFILEVVLDLISSIVIGTVLNVVSFLKFKLYLKAKYQEQLKNEEIQMLPLSKPATISSNTKTNEFAITNVKRKAIPVKTNKKPINNLDKRFIPEIDPRIRLNSLLQKEYYHGE